MDTSTHARQHARASKCKCGLKKKNEKDIISSSLYVILCEFLP